jgi:uncharacterized protein with PIN domain
MDMGKLREISEHRVCPVCRVEFRTIPAKKDEAEVPALWQFSDHLRIHQPTQAQWTEAHNKIQAGKESAKAAERRSLSV